MLVKARVDLSWADDQYWSTLFGVIRELTKERPKKKKVGASQIDKYVKD